MKTPAPQEQRTFFVTAIAHQRHPLFREAKRADLLIEVFKESRAKGRFLLHEFVIMPDHIHLLLTPAADVSLEKAVQFIKGGFSFRVKKELGYRWEVWQQSFTEHRIKDAADYERHREYVRMNPVRARLVERSEDYPHGSASGSSEVDPTPEWFKGRG